ncbi:MAG: type II toxin-antitoxin system ParD family antitoxin, partial [Chloroflexia bacterium]|nr:type II toxin-antitoxin system ParD family antitoxin [Chloroflexia bacterium]
MTVTLTPRIEAMVRQKLAAGAYGTADEVIEEAMRLLEQRDQLERLRASLDEADAELDRGEGIEWTPALMEQLAREGDALLLQGVTPDPD